MEVDLWDSGSAIPWVKISAHCFLHIYFEYVRKRSYNYVLYIGYGNVYQYWMDNKRFFLFYFYFILFLGKRWLARLPLQKILRLSHQEMLIHKFWDPVLLVRRRVRRS